jgi:hypothetical protein
LAERRGGATRSAPLDAVIDPAIPPSWQGANGPARILRIGNTNPE